MPDIFEILHTVVYVGSGLSFLMAIQQLSGRNPDRLNALGFLLLVCNGIIMLNVGLGVSRLQAAYPASSFLFLTALFAVGPLNLFYDHSLLDPSQPIPYKTRLHILPAALFFVFEIVFQFQSSGLKQEMIGSLFDNPLESPFALTVMIGCAHVLGYLAYLSMLEYSLWDRPEIKTEIRLMAGINLLAKLSVAVLAAGFFWKKRPLLVSGGVILTLIHVAIFLAHQRYPQFFQTIKREIKQKRYEKTLLSGVNTEIIYTRLMELMKDEQLYKDMELTLKTVADILAITPHQLSQFLNEHLGVDFRNFINRFRVEEAQRLLKSDPEMSILTICFEVGFNSKSTFNTAFKKISGITPREYRGAGNCL